MLKSETGGFQAVILAGGLGSRLGDLTKKIPKPLIPVRGRPFLEWQLMYLKSQNFKRILLLTGYKGEMIEDHFQDGARLGLEITYSQEPTPLGTGGALLLALEKLENQFALLFGDSFLPVTTGEIFASVSTRDEIEIAMSVYDNREDTTVPFNVSLDKKGDVLQYEKGKSSPDLTFVDGGVYGVKKACLLGQEPRSCSFESEILGPAIRAGKVASWVSPQRFYDIGTPERLKLFEERIHDYFPNTI